jgi:hypothetical protein
MNSQRPERGEKHCSDDREIFQNRRHGMIVPAATSSSGFWSQISVMQLAALCLGSECQTGNPVRA